MSIFTVAECDQIIAGLKNQFICDPAGTIGSVTIAGRTVAYRSAEELETIINMWTRLRSDAVKAECGVGRTSMSVAKFS